MGWILYLLGITLFTMGVALLVNVKGYDTGPVRAAGLAAIALAVVSCYTPGALRFLEISGLTGLFVAAVLPDREPGEKPQ